MYKKKFRNLFTTVITQMKIVLILIWTNPTRFRESPLQVMAIRYQIITLC